MTQSRIDRQPLSVSLQKNTLIFLFVTAMCVASGRQAFARPDGLCVPVHATIKALFVATDCSSPVGLCTAGQITGGLLNGTTNFTALGIAPAAGMPGIEPETTLSYHGVLEITTQHGTLTISDIGAFDQAVGVYSEIDRITAGTGRFENATGTLFIYGNAFPDGSGFDGAVRGRICLQ